MIYPKFEWIYNKYLDDVRVFDSYILKLYELFYDFYKNDLSDKYEKIKIFNNFYLENIKFFEYNDIDNIEYLDYCLFIDKIPYEVFTSIDMEKFWKQDKILIDKIFYWDVKICFFDNFSKVAILTYNNTFSERINDILYN